MLRPKIESSTILRDLSLLNLNKETKKEKTLTGKHITLPTSKGELLNGKDSGSRNFFLVSAHREENVDNKENLIKILTVLNKLAENYDFPVIVSTHPRTRKRLENISDMAIHPLVSFQKPFGFTDYVKLQMNVKCTLSDSGTISEESAILNFPAVSVRQSMERPEAQDSGTIILTGFNSGTVLDSVKLAIYENERKIQKMISPDYLVPDTSWRVLKLIMGLSTLSNKWHGIN